HRLCRWSRPYLTYVIPDLAVAPGIAGGAELFKQPLCAQQREHLQPRSDNPAIGIDLPCNRGTWPIADRLSVQIPIQLPALDPVIDRAAAHAESPGQLRLAHPLFQIVA